VKPGKHNVGLYNLYRLESEKGRGSLDDESPNTLLFRVEVVPDKFI
jgi:hypothetical protein